MKKRSFPIALSLLVILVLFLSACGTDDTSSEDYQTTDTPATEEAATLEPVVDATSNVPGEIVYDFGFNPQENGFRFENYGDDIPATNLTSAEMRRMFGDQVCADLNGDECILTPPAEQWMEQVNGDMAGGHCEGMAVLSLMMYTQKVSPQDFGGITASDLDINNEDLQREIAYWWATQAVAPTYTSVF